MSVVLITSPCASSSMLMIRLSGCSLFSASSWCGEPSGSFPLCAPGRSRRATSQLRPGICLLYDDRPGKAPRRHLRPSPPTASAPDDRPRHTAGRPCGQAAFAGAGTDPGDDPAGHARQCGAPFLAAAASPSVASYRLPVMWNRHCLTPEPADQLTCINANPGRRPIIPLGDLPAGAAAWSGRGRALFRGAVLGMPVSAG